jgi:hypothetical protein
VGVFAPPDKGGSCLAWYAIIGTAVFEVVKMTDNTKKVIKYLLKSRQNDWNKWTVLITWRWDFLAKLAKCVLPVGVKTKIERHGRFDCCVDADGDDKGSYAFDWFFREDRL